MNVTILTPSLRCAEGYLSTAIPSPWAISPINCGSPYCDAGPNISTIGGVVVAAVSALVACSARRTAASVRSSALGRARPDHELQPAGDWRAKRTTGAGLQRMQLRLHPPDIADGSAAEYTRIGGTRLTISLPRAPSHTGVTPTMERTP